MKRAWESKPLSELCSIELGRTPSRAMSSYWDPSHSSRHVWLSIADLLQTTAFRVSDSREYLSDNGASISKIVKKGTLLVSFKLTLGRVAFAGRDLYTNEAIAALVPFDTKELLSTFLFYFFQYFDWNRATEGDAKIKGRTLNKAKLSEVAVPVPPMKEQQRIVGILDKALENIAVAKANTEKNIANARELFESELALVFSNCPDSWRTETISKHVVFIDYRGRTPKKTPSGLKLITAKNIRMGYVKDDPAEFIDPEDYAGWMTRGIPQYGDVLFTTEAPLANVAQLVAHERVAFAQRVIVMHPDHSVLDSTFLKYALMSSPMQRLIHDKGTGATATGIKASLLKQIPIRFPRSISEQHSIVERLDTISEFSGVLYQQYDRKNSALDGLKQSILHAAFNGEL